VVVYSFIMNNILNINFVLICRVNTGNLKMCGNILHHFSAVVYNLSYSISLRGRKCRRYSCDRLIGRGNYQTSVFVYRKFATRPSLRAAVALLLAYVQFSKRHAYRGTYPYEKDLLVIHTRLKLRWFLTNNLHTVFSHSAFNKFTKSRHHRL
jgi:hypothetical protein